MKKGGAWPETLVIRSFLLLAPQPCCFSRALTVNSQPKTTTVRSGLNSTGLATTAEQSHSRTSQTVKRGGSPLNRDGASDEELWARRRHVHQLLDIVTIFRMEFEASRDRQIRAVYASWVIQPKAYYADALEWVGNEFEEPKRFCYAIADTAYYNAERAPADADVTAILASMRASSNASRPMRQAIRKIAEQYGLKHFQYEIGPDTGGGSVVNVGNRIRAHRDARIQELVVYDAISNWFEIGGDLYVYFSSCGAYHTAVED